MLEVGIFYGVTLGLLMLVRPATRLFESGGLAAAATLLIAWLALVLSIEYAPTNAEVRDDLDGLGLVVHQLFSWCFGILYGGAGLITCWRAYRDLVQRKKA